MKKDKAQRHREIADCLLRQSVSAASGVGQQRTEDRGQKTDKRRKKKGWLMFSE